MAAFHHLRALVSCGEHSAVIKNLLADMGRLVRGVGNNGFCFPEGRRYIDFIKGYAVMDISGGNDGLQNESMPVAGRVGPIGKLPLVLSLYKETAVRVGHAFCDHTSLVFLSAGQLLSGGVVLSLLWWLVIIVERLLPIGFPIWVHLLLQYIYGLRHGSQPCLFRIVA